MTCPVCEFPAATTAVDPLDRNSTHVDCLRCGKFNLSKSLVASLPKLLEQDDATPKLSHVIRKSHEARRRLLLTTQMAEAVLKNPLPRPREQADLLVQWLAQNSPGPGESIKMSFDEHCAVVGAKSHAGFDMLIDHLSRTGVVTGPSGTYMSGEMYATIHLTFEGWDHYETLRRGGATYRKAFMAMKFGDPELNSLLRSTFRPSAKRAGFDLFKLDDNPKAGLIDDRLRVEIRSSDFVIADLTHDNLGAYWEAGYAEGLGKPVIYTCERKKFEVARTHFDTNHHLTIVWDANSQSSAGEQLVQTIRATLPHIANLADD